MSEDGGRWEDAWTAAALLALDPHALGGAIVRARAGSVRDRWLAHFRSLLASECPVGKIPAHVTEDRLLGGLDLAATLSAGTVVAERGLLASHHNGVVLMPMAERCQPATVAHLCSALDHAEVALERDGITARTPARIALIALDEGIDDERVAPALRDRLGIHLDLDGIAQGDADEIDDGMSERLLAAARELEVDVSEDARRALCSVAFALGIDSIRAPMLALRVARASAILAAREAVEEEDISLAARLVLGPRATRLPAPPPEEAPEDDAPPPPPPDDSESQPEDPEDRGDVGRLEDRILEAVQSAMPAGLLSALALAAARGAAQTRGTAGVLKSSKTHGRRVGVRRGVPRGGARLNVLETLRAAAPWQPVRRRLREEESLRRARRVEVRKDDFRIHRYQERTETTTVFVVDASGSAALQRLAEAKGAVERVLADCYVRRDQVAMIAFRDEGATLVLPPTKSLVRAKRILAGLPGGGATPLASGIDAGLVLAKDCARRGQTPVVVFMTDGRANVARDGTRGRAQAREDALASARALAMAGFATLFVDTGARSQEGARELAAAMNARYLHLPYSDVERISQTVQSVGATS